MNFPVFNLFFYVFRLVSIGLSICVSLGMAEETVPPDAVRMANGVMVVRASGSPFTGTISKPIHYHHILLSRYVDGKAHGVWERRTTDGVTVSEKVYVKGGLDVEASDERVLKLRERNRKQFAKNSDALFFTDLGVAGYHYSLQRPDQALAYYQAALNHAKPMSVMASTAHVGVGRSCLRLRQYEQAELHLKKALAIREVQAGRLSGSVLWPLRELTTLYRYTSDHENADETWERVIQIQQKLNGKNHHKTIEARLGQAEDWVRSGKGSAALAVAEIALQQLKGDSEENLRLRAIACRRIVQVKTAQERHEEALAFSFKELEYVERLPVNRRSWGWTLHRNIAQAYLALGKPGAARDYLLKMMAQRGPQSDQQGQWLIEAATVLATACIEMKEFDEAKAVLDRVKVPEQHDGRLSSSWAKYYDARFRLQMNLGKPVVARLWAHRMRMVQKNVVHNMVRYGSERQRAGLANALSNSVFGNLANSGDIEGLADCLLQTKGWVINSAKSDLLTAYHSNDPTVRKLLQQRRELHDELVGCQVIQMLHERRMQQAGLGGAVESVILLPELPSQFEIRQKIDVVGKRIHDAIRNRPEWVDLTTATRKELARALPQDAVLLDYFRYEHFEKAKKGIPYFGCLIQSRDREPQFVALGSGEKIALLLNRIPQGTPQTEAAYRATMQELYRHLILPVARHWPAVAKVLYICPDEALNFLSFATIMNLEGRFLGEHYSIAYVHSAADLLLPKIIPGNQSVRVFADPVFRAEPDAKAEFGFAAMRSGEREMLNPLPFTRREAEQVQATVARSGGEVQLNLGLEATEEQLRLVRSPRTLHVATHGISNASSSSSGQRHLAATLADGTQSACLVFTGAEHILQEWERERIPNVKLDGVMGPDELSCLQLGGTSLVVLSACHTGKGSATTGQGVVGLRRSLAIAGARNILMTHWAVSDRWTQEFMTDFYDHYSQSGNPVQALGVVQSEWLKELREDEGAKVAAEIAGPFFIVTQGRR